MNRDEAIKDLSQFTGTETYHKGWCGVIWTDGVFHFYNNIGGWLITDISSYAVNDKIKKHMENDGFMVWKLKRKNKGAILTGEDGNDNVIVTQEYGFVDLPEDFEPQFYWALDSNGIVMMLPGEY